MIIYSQTETLQALCKAANKYGMLVSFYPPDDDYALDEIQKAAPYLKGNYQVLFEWQAYLLFDSEAECREYFGQTVGDDGPTATNPYSGEAKVYALTCGPDGALLNENT